MSLLQNNDTHSLTGFLNMALFLAALMSIIHYVNDNVLLLSRFVGSGSSEEN